MKSIRLSLLLLLASSVFAAETAYDVRITQVNDAGTGFAQRNVTPTAYGLLGWDGSKHPGNITPAAFDGYFYAADAGSNDTYAITLTPALSVYTTGAR